MIVVPKEKPVMKNLNSYYLDIERLCEHFQGEIGSGCIHFRSKDVNGLLFFDKDDLLNAIVEGKDVQMSGETAATALIEMASKNNFALDLYQIEPESVYFWAGFPAARKIYNGLSAEFTDVEGLIKKMETEKLTGCIEVRIGNGNEGGILFFSNGESVSGSFSWGAAGKSGLGANRDRLIQKVRKHGGTFDVSRISPTPEKMAGNDPKHLIPALEEFLGTFESCVAEKDRRVDFSPLLKRKFVEQADNFPFLDPFAGEFEYHQRKILFNGNTDGVTLSAAVFECCRQLAEELGVLQELRDNLSSWRNKYTGRLADRSFSF